MKFCYLIVTTLLASTVWLTAPMTIFNSKLYHQTFVAGISVSIPTSLVTLQEGRHAVKVGDVEIGVALIRQNNDVIGPEFEISSPVPESKLRTEIPISELLAEVMIYASVLRKDVKISLDSTKVPMFSESGADEKVNWVTTFDVPLASLPRSIIQKHNLLHRGIGVLVMDTKGRVYVHQRSASKRVFPSMYDMFVGGVTSTGETSYETLLRELNEELGLDFTTSSVDSVESVAAIEIDETVVRKKNPYSDRIGEGKMFPDKAAFEEFIKNPAMSQKEKKNILVSETVEHVCESINSKESSLSYIGRTVVQTSYNHCIVECYAAICSDKLASMICFPDGEVQWGEWKTLEELNAMLLDESKVFVPDGLQVWDALPLITSAYKSV